MAELKTQTPGGYTIFCDDLRQDTLGKHIYTGVYNGKITIGAVPPIMLPKIAMAVHYIERPGESDEPVSLVVYFPGDDQDKPSLNVPVPVEQLRATPIPNDEEADDPQFMITLNFEISPFVINKAGRVKVRARRGELDIRLGSLMVEFDPSLKPAAPAVVFPSVQQGPDGL